MNPHNFLMQGGRLVLAAFVAVVVLAGCGGSDGATGPAGPAGQDGDPGTPVLPASAASEVAIEITGVTVSSPPVVEFTATEANGILLTGLKVGRGGNLRFTIAKLTPGTNGDPSAWQSYINNSSSQATYERDGTLEDLGNGQFRYTFETDIADPAQTGGISYDPSLTHRVAIQVDGFPAHNPILDFVPAGGAVTVTRDIVKTETCNTCHNKLAMHGGGRIETQYCVACHNPGTIDPDSGNTVDFSVMIHKIHRGEHLPSVESGTPYQIIGFRGSVHDYSTVVFPQDIRNCTKCHDGSNPQGDAWQSPNMVACGSCHDDVNFATGENHGEASFPGGVVVADNSECPICHTTGRAGTVAETHTIPASAPKVASGKFQYNIIEICGVDITTDPPGEPVCAPGTAPVVTFSVSDPTQLPGSGTHGYDNLYDVAGATSADRDPEFASDGFGGASPDASLNILTAWNTLDYTNEGGAGTRPSRADSTSALTNAVDNTDGTFTITLDALPVMVDVPATIPLTGSGAIGIEGHPLGESDPVNDPGVFDITVPVKGEVAYFAITDTAPVARRVAVDVETKCDNCHDQLSIHGANRAENAQLCVLCHNPKGTDVGRRPKNGGVPDDTATLDGKREESIDLKRLIHAIHAGQKDDPATPEVEGHGFREKGIVVYGYSSAHDYSHVRFPGILSDCTTCHNAGTYELTGRWETPTQDGILPSTMLAAPTATNGSELGTELDDQRVDEIIISPTAAVCSACHDSESAQWHMEMSGGTAQFDILLADLYPYEDCATCHGPGRAGDVKVVHGVD